MTTGQPSPFGSRNPPPPIDPTMRPDMLHRRSLLTIIAALGIAGWRSAHAQSATERATAFVKATGDKLVGIINGSSPGEQRRQALTRVIDGAVDVDGVARFCLGRFWRQASPAQQQSYLQAFHGVLVTNITAKLGEYQGVKYTVNRAVPDGDNVKVDTTVMRPNNPPTNVQWVIENAASDPKIVDVIAEGTSLRLTQRSDYQSYLSHNNDSIDALISAMRQEVEQNRASG
jgi:phospholipid transport system substrate-binding protein